MRWLKFALFLGVPLGIFAAVLYLDRQREAAALQTADQGPAPLSTELVCQGYVDLLGGITPLQPLQPSRVVEILVVENQEVVAGDVLVKFDDSLAREAVAEAQAMVHAAQQKYKVATHNPHRQELLIQQQERAVEGARAGLEIARHRADLAKATSRERDEAEKAAKDARGRTGVRPANAEEPVDKTKDSDKSESEVIQEAIGDEQIRVAEATLKAEEAKLDSLKLVDPTEELQLIRAEVDLAEARLRQAKAALAHQCELRSPQAGRVMRVLVSPGQLVGPMQPALQFAPDVPRIVRVEIEQTYADDIVIDAPVSLSDDRRPDRAWTGRVLRLSQWYSRPRTSVDETSALVDVRTIECTITVDDPSELRIGQRVWARIARDNRAAEQQPPVATKGQVGSAL